MDIAKYLTNKDITLTNDDINIAKLENDIRKGYYSKDEFDKSTEGYIEKSKYDKLDNDLKEMTKKYTEVETNFNNTTKTLSDTNDKLANTMLEKNMVLTGFKEEHFEEVSKLRNSLFADETDDKKALESVKEKFKGTYFPEDGTPTVPNEPAIGGAGSGNSTSTSNIKITRDTTLNDMIVGNKQS